MNYSEEQLEAAEKKAWGERIERINSYLKSCPCCGGKAEIKGGFNKVGRFGYVTVYIECSRCGLRTKELNVDGRYGEQHIPEEAAEVWNRRYSGINDKNGKPICDGSHIRIAGEYWAEGISGEYEVCYSNICFDWYLKKVISTDDSSYIGNRLFSFSELNLGQFTDDIELIEMFVRRFDIREFI